MRSPNPWTRAAAGATPAVTTLTQLSEPAQPAPAGQVVPTLMFPDALDRVKREAGLWHEDVMVEPRELEATPQGDLRLAGVGPLRLTDWSCGQLARQLGIRWQKWFDGIPGEARAEELNRRLALLADPWKLRLRLPRRDEPCSPGVLAAITSPTYTPISDLAVMEALQESLGRRVAERLRFREVRFTDRATHLAVISEEAVELPVGERTERYFAGFHLRNSQVGYAALSMVVSFLRLVCVNGLLLAEGSFRLLYRTHRPLKEGALEKLLSEAFGKLPFSWRAGLERLAYAHGLPLGDPEREVRRVLKQTPGLLSYTPAVLSELAREGATRFGLVQALTSVARGSHDREERYELERLAGSLLLREHPAGREPESVRLLPASPEER